MTGEIIRRGKSKHQVRIFLGRDANGKRRFYFKTISGNKKTAQSHLTKVLRELDTNTFIEPDARTLNEYLDHWLNASAKPRLRARTFYEYSKLLDRYVRPELGPRRLASIAPLDVQSLYSKLQESKLSARTIRYAHAVLSSALKQAVKWRMLGSNPAAFVDLPRMARQEMQALSPEQAQRFLKAAKGTRFEAMFLLALTTGMRPSEYLGLQWKDINFRAGEITVQRGLSRHKNEWHFDEPKTPKSRRTIPIPREVVNALAAHKRKQAEARLKSAAEYREHDLVFTAGNGMPLNLHNLIHDYFKPLLKTAKLPQTLRLYDLRHSCATLLLAAGENPKVVSERLGHASVTLTLDTYSHVLPMMQKSATERLRGVLFGTRLSTQ